METLLLHITQYHVMLIYRIALDGGIISLNKNETIQSQSSGPLVEMLSFQPLVFSM